MAEEAESNISYLTRFRLTDGTEKEGRFTTRRPRAVGDAVNFPTGADGASGQGKGYIWRVSAIEPSADPSIEEVLVLDFERAFPESPEAQA